MRILGISGRRQAGKDTLARDLQTYMGRRFNVRIASTSDWPKSILESIGVPHAALHGTDEQKTQPVGPGIHTGRSAARKLMDTFYEVNPRACMEQVVSSARHRGCDILLVPGVRNEPDCQVILENSGRLLRLTRMPFPADTEQEETALDGYTGWDCVIDNRALTPAQTALRAMEYLDSKGWFK